MNIRRVYIDTSVVGGFIDPEFQEDTRQFFKMLEDGEMVFVVSDLMELELLEAPSIVGELLSRYSKHCFEKVCLTEEAMKLAASYIVEKVVGKSSVEDCRHIAIATIAKVDVLASWNFRHIVNLDKIRGYNSVNLRNGYSILEIRSPKELLKNE